MNALLLVSSAFVEILISVFEYLVFISTWKESCHCHQMSADLIFVID